MEYIQVHPTFLYESIATFIIALIIVLYTKKKKYDGQLFLIYLAGYGVVRAILEGLRTDQLLLWNTKLAVSQLLSIVVATIAILILVFKAISGKNRTKDSKHKTDKCKEKKESKDKTNKTKESKDNKDKVNKDTVNKAKESKDNKGKKNE